MMRMIISPKYPFATLLVFLITSMLIANQAWAALTLKAEANPNPVAPSQMLDVQISVASTSATGALTLRVLWPEELDPSPVIRGGGVCNPNCSAGGYVVWNLGVLEASTSITVSFTERVRGTTLDGTMIPLDIALLENEIEQASVALSVEVQTESPLELVVDPLSDPVASGATLVYEIVYGNAGAASVANSVLNFPIPDGTQFLSATGGGVQDGGNVSWNLGSLAPHSGARVWVTVQLDVLDDGTLLSVDSASLKGDITFQPNETRAMAVSRVDDEVLELNIEVNPDPVGPNQVLDSQITVSNPTAAPTGALTLRVLWPEELDPSPVIRGGGVCNPNCSAGGYVVWDLGVLGPRSSAAVSFNETVRGTSVDGTIIPLEVELLEGEKPVRNVSHSVAIQTESPLELAVDPLSDPVVSAETLEYEIVYSNTGAASAANSVLNFPIPDGTQFLSATGGGVHDGNNVSWNLGSLAPHSGGRERVTVQLDSLSDGSLLLIDAATLSGDVNFQAKEARAMAVSRVIEQALELQLEVNPDPVGPNQVLDTQITISNPTGDATGELTLRVLWPEELNPSPVIRGGGVCNPNCSAGGYVVWNLGVLGPTSSASVSFNETVRGNTIDGAIIPLEAELLEGGVPIRNISHSVTVNEESPLELAIDPLSDPVSSGATLVYEIVYSNTGTASAENSELIFPVPNGTQFQSATDDGVYDDGNVSWNLGSLAPNSSGRVRVMVLLDDLDEGTLLWVDDASFTGVINFQKKETRAMAVSRVVDEALELDLEVNPDPVGPNQVLDSQITVSNPSGNASGILTLRVLWPEELGASPIVTGGGLCNPNCGAGGYLVWNLGALGPTTSATVSFNETVRGSTIDGTIIPLEVELLEGGIPVRNISHNVSVQEELPLELAVDPLSDPVASGATLVYAIVYGHSGSSNVDNSVLRFPIPIGTQFLSVTGGGVQDGDSVVWSLGSLAPNSGGRVLVTVNVDDLEEGTLLLVDAATLSGDINFQTKEVRAMAVSRVVDETLELDLVASPNPVLPNENLKVEITVGNPTGITTGTTSLRVLWPGALGASPVVTGGGICKPNCSPGGYLIWDLGLLGPNTDVTVSFTETVRQGTPHGSRIPLEVELIEGGLPARSISETVLVNLSDDFDNDGIPDIYDDDDDNDGMPDWCEIRYGLNPFDPSDADDDPDEDGLTNLEECLAGTDPFVNNDLIFKDSFESL